MMGIVNLLQTLIAYSAWASQRLLDAAAQLSEDDLNHDFKTSDHSVRGTLAHVFAADRLWLARLLHEPATDFASDTRLDLPQLQTEWPQLGARWKEWADGLTEDCAASEFAYSDMRGRPWSQPVWKIVLHAVNHATHHRGQVAGFLRALGQTPPPIDSIVHARKG